MWIDYILNYPYMALKKFFSFYPEIRVDKNKKKYNVQWKQILVLKKTT